MKQMLRNESTALGRPVIITGRGGGGGAGVKVACFHVIGSMQASQETTVHSFFYFIFLFKEGDTNVVVCSRDVLS